MAMVGTKNCLLAVIDRHPLSNIKPTPAFNWRARTEGARNMEPLTVFLSSMIALSVGVERVVEIIKGFSKNLREDPKPDPDGKGAARRHVVLQVIAAVAGAIIALAIGPKTFVQSLPVGNYTNPTQWIAAVLLGLMASGGSAFWNHALDIVGATKSVKERVANLQKAPAAPRPTLPVGP